MSKRTPDFIIQQMAEGSIAERTMIREDYEKAVKPLIRDLPSRQPDRTTYLRNLVSKVMKNEIDIEVFKIFAKRTNTYVELQNVSPRLRMINRNERRK
jgi:hypothetical protein